MKSKKPEVSPINRIEKMKDNGILSIYWEYGENYTTTHAPNDDKTPNKVKRMIAQSLLNELKIPIRIDERTDYL